MASGPYPDIRRGTWAIQWFDGVRWKRTVVVKKRPGWKEGDAMPKNPPPEAKAALGEYQKKEDQARKRKGYHPDRLLSEFLQAHLDGYDVSRQPGSKLALLQVTAVFREWCDSNKLKKLEDVTSEVCHQWMADRAATKAVRSGKKLEYATLKKELGLLATAWSEALRRGNVESNPWKTVQVPGKPSSKKRGSWSPEEYEKLLAVCRPWLRDFLIFGCHTGLRVEALGGVEWRDVKPEQERAGGLGHLIVRPELDKSGKGYSVPIHPKVHDLIARRFIHSRFEHDLILATPRGIPVSSKNVTAKAIVAACKRAGLKRPDSPNHHCRRTFGRWAVLGHLTGKRVPVYIVSQWLGHASIQMTQRYLDVSESDSSAFMMGMND